MNPSEGPGVAVIVVAAGSGSRLGHAEPKAFVPLAGRTILSRSLDAIFALDEAVQVVIVAPADRVELAERLGSDVAGPASAYLSVVAGGLTRQQSVARGLSALADSVHTVLVHDAARALTPVAQFEAVMGAVAASGCGAVPGLPVSDTIKRTDSAGTALETVDRAELSAVQTPQGFPRNQLTAAYASAGDDFTDDAALVAQAGHPVKIIPGDPLAFKITTAWDLRRAEQELATAPAAGTAPGAATHPGVASQSGAATQPGAASQSGAATQAPLPRTGIGVDSHAFAAAADEQPLWLAGLYWPGENGLAGHSDGDAVAHAICDALLSASGLGDIGSAFGTSDPRFAGARGEVFITETLRMLAAAGFGVGNVAVQLIGNRPRFAARRSEAEQVLTGILGAPVAISATTTDGLGFTGRGEGVVAIATALVVPV